MNRKEAIPFFYFLSVLDTLNRDELVILHKRIEERLALYTKNIEYIKSHRHELAVKSTVEVAQFA